MHSRYCAETSIARIIFTLAPMNTNERRANNLMKTKLLFFNPTFCLLFLSGMSGIAGEPQPQRPSAMPESQLIVRSSAPKAVDSEDLAEALGIHQWNFQLQVPDGTSHLRAAMHLIQNGTDRDLGSITL